MNYPYESKKLEEKDLFEGKDVQIRPSGERVEIKLYTDDGDPRVVFKDEDGIERVIYEDIDGHVFHDYLENIYEYDELASKGRSAYMSNPNIWDTMMKEREAKGERENLLEQLKFSSPILHAFLTKRIVNGGSSKNKSKRNKSKRNKSKRNKSKRNKSKRNKSKRNKSKRNKSKRNKSKRNKSKRNKSKRNKSKRNKSKRNKSKRNKSKRNKSKRR